jgi:DNA topoisomerase-1
LLLSARAILTKQSKDCSELVLATDEDREGEAISWHLKQVLQPQVPTKRAIFTEITKVTTVQSYST